MSKWGGVCLLFLLVYGICRNLGVLFGDVKFYSFGFVFVLGLAPCVGQTHWISEMLSHTRLSSNCILKLTRGRKRRRRFLLAEIHILQTLTAFWSTWDKEFIDWSEERRSFNSRNNRSWTRTVKLKYDILWQKLHWNPPMPNFIYYQSYLKLLCFLNFALLKKMYYSVLSLRNIFNKWGSASAWRGYRMKGKEGVDLQLNRSSL